MKTKFYLKGKKITQKAAKEILGSRFDATMKDAKETYREDPNIEISYMVSGGILTIEFVI